MSNFDIRSLTIAPSPGPQGREFHGFLVDVDGGAAVNAGAAALGFAANNANNAFNAAPGGGSGGGGGGGAAFNAAPGGGGAASAPTVAAPNVGNGTAPGTAPATVIPLAAAAPAANAPPANATAAAAPLAAAAASNVGNGGAPLAVNTTALVNKIKQILKTPTSVDQRVDLYKMIDKFNETSPPASNILIDTFITPTALTTFRANLAKPISDAIIAYTAKNSSINFVAHDAIDKRILFVIADENGLPRTPPPNVFEFFKRVELAQFSYIFEILKLKNMGFNLNGEEESFYREVYEPALVNAGYLTPSTSSSVAAAPFLSSSSAPSESTAGGAGAASSSAGDASAASAASLALPPPRRGGRRSFTRKRKFFRKKSRKYRR